MAATSASRLCHASMHDAVTKISLRRPHSAPNRFTTMRGSSVASTSAIRMRNVARPKTKPPPNRPQSEKREMVVERLKLLGLCGLDGGR